MNEYEWMNTCLEQIGLYIDTGDQKYYMEV